MAFNRSGCSGSTSRTTERGMKKTPWTPSEDNMLLEYIRHHGEGDWSSIQKKSGLNKSGKSCRNRWANYLRPDLKKGAFSSEEEKLIIELHEKFGNKWARIAAELPGRTDNEVKNYWNIRLKKCQRSGLAIHPHEMYQINQPLNSSPLPTFSSLSTSSQPQDPNILCFSNSVISPSPNDPLPNILDKSNSANNLMFARDNNGSVALSLMASNTLVTMPSVNQILPNTFPVQPIQENSLNFSFNPGPNKGVLGLQSMQSPEMVKSTLRPFSSDSVTTTPNNVAEDFEVIESNMHAEASGSGTNFIDDELSRLLNDCSPLASPLAEWDDLHPRRCPEFCKY